MLSAVQYIRDHSLDVNVINAHCEALGVLPAIFDGWGGFRFASEAEWKTTRSGGQVPVVRAPFIGVMDEGQAIDVVAWRSAEPQSFATLHGQAIGLGFEQLVDPASWAFGERLMVHRTPLRWLKAGCRGYVPLCHRHGFLALRLALGDIEAEDDEHAEALDRLINPGEWRHEIIVPT